MSRRRPGVVKAQTRAVLDRSSAPFYSGVTSDDSNPQNLRTEYAVIGSYVTAMTGLRFQLMGLYLAAVGFIFSRGTPSSLNAALILGVSIGLWILDLRNRDLLARHGERGRKIERAWGYGEGAFSEAGGDGFFHDEKVPPRLRIFVFEFPGHRGMRWERVISHGVGIDLVFLGVIVYAVVLLAWPGH